MLECAVLIRNDRKRVFKGVSGFLEMLYRKRNDKGEQLPVIQEQTMYKFMPVH